MPTSQLERLNLGGFELNDGTTFTIEDGSFSFEPAQAKPLFATNAGADGDALLQEVHYTNSKFTFTLRIEPQADMDTALEKLGELVAVLQECGRIEGGQELVWTPHDTESPLTAYVLLAELNGIPITQLGDDAGYLLAKPSPVLKVTLIARPFLFAEERTVVKATESGAEPTQSVYASGVSGDVAAEARLRLTDKATRARRYADFYIEDLASTEGNPALQILAAGLVVTGFAGSSTTRTGAYSEEKVKRLAVAAAAVRMCSTPALTNIGSFRVKARLYAAAEGMLVRMCHKTGAGPEIAGEWFELPTTGKWVELDLGVAIFEEVEQGTQASYIYIDGKTEGTVGEALDLNYLFNGPSPLQVARSPIAPLAAPTTFKARDEFNQTAGALNGKALPDGSGNWATEGSAKGDFEVVAGTTHAVRRENLLDAEARVAKPPGGKFSVLAMQVSWEWSNLNGFWEPSIDLETGLRFGTTTPGKMVAKRIATALEGDFSMYLEMCGVVMDYVWLPKTRYTFTMLILGGGLAAGWLTTNGAFPTGEPTLVSASAVTGEQQPYLFDYYSSPAHAVTRTYDDFSMWVPSISYVCESGKTMEFNHQATEKADSTGTYWGAVPFARGGRFYLPCEGPNNRVSRITARMRDNDIAGGEVDEQVTRKQSIEVLARERFIRPA